MTEPGYLDARVRSLSGGCSPDGQPDQELVSLAIVLPQKNTYDGIDLECRLHGRNTTYNS